MVCFFIFLFALLLTDIYFFFFASSARVTMTKTGPNDVFGVVWAIGTRFFLFFSCFWILTNFFNYI